MPLPKTATYLDVSSMAQPMTSSAEGAFPVERRLIPEHVRPVEADLAGGSLFE
jgi:hypothetical protein